MSLAAMFAARPGALAAAFATVYLAVDVAYVLRSRPTYEAVARAISGEGFPAMAGTRALGAAAAYAAMGLAWLAFVPLATRAWAPALGGRRALSGAAAGAAAGAALAAAIYVVFNGTLHATFAGWDARIAARDTLWGVAWLTALSAAYGAASESIAKKK